MNKEIRLAAFDIDGTLTNSEKRLTQATRDAIAHLMDNGTTIVLASGRPSFGLHHLANELQMPTRGGYLLAYNGGKVLDCRDNHLMTETKFPRHLLPQLLAAAERHGCALVTYDDPNDLILASRRNEWVDHESQLNNSMPLRIVDNLDAEAPANVPKCLMAGEPDLLAKIVPLLQAEFSAELDICRSAPFFIEIVPKGIDKAAKLDELAHQLGLTSANVAAFGDGQNDLGMIRYAGLGIAMDNAFPEVKAAADFVTLSNDNDGVAHAIRTLGL